MTAPDEEEIPPPEAASDLTAYIPLIRSYLRKFIRSDEIEDAVQTVLARAIESRDRFKGESKEHVWILGIARNVGLETGRGRSRRGVSMDEPDDAQDDSEAPPKNQEDILGDRQQQALALLALDSMPLEDRLVLLITYVDETPGPQAAEILGIGFAAFRQRLSRARKTLAKEIERLKDDGARPDLEQLLRWKALLDPHGHGREE